MPKKDNFSPQRRELEPEGKTPPKVKGEVKGKSSYILPSPQDSGLILNPDIAAPGFYQFRKNALAYAWADYYKNARPGAVITMPDGTVIQYGKVGDATATIFVPGQPSFTVPRAATGYDVQVWNDGVDPVVAQQNLDYQVTLDAYREMVEALGKNPVDLDIPKRKRDWFDTLSEWVLKWDMSGPRSDFSRKPPTLKFGLGENSTPWDDGKDGKNKNTKKGPGGVELRTSYFDWYQYIFNVEGPGGLNIYLGNKGKAHAGVTDGGQYAKFDNHTGLGLVIEPIIDLGFMKMKPKVEAWEGPRVELDKDGKSKNSKRGVKAEVQFLNSDDQPVDSWINEVIDSAGSVVDPLVTVLSFLGLSGGGLVSNEGNSVDSSTTRVATAVAPVESARHRCAKPVAGVVVPDTFNAPMLRISMNGDDPGFGKIFIDRATSANPIIDSDLNSFVQELEPNALLQPMAAVIDQSARMMADVTRSAFQVGGFTDLAKVSRPRRTVYNFNGFDSKIVSGGVARTNRR
ncbi:hypothetical protein [Nocardia sp. NPDC057668]|uniref:hypothetical protein n=1 Tax=Nocardia sp. NPDC057668 TaxID=3346202 RepID=UPI00366E8825